MQRKKIITRQQAIDKGVLVYFTGKPCLNGHIVNRYTLNGACIECLRVARNEKRQIIKQNRIKAVS